MGPWGQDLLCGAIKAMTKRHTFFQLEIGLLNCFYEAVDKAG